MEGLATKALIPHFQHQGGPFLSDAETQSEIDPAIKLDKTVRFFPGKAE